MHRHDSGPGIQHCLAVVLGLQDMERASRPAH